MRLTRQWYPLAVALSVGAGAALIAGPASAVPAATTAVRLVTAPGGASPNGGVGDVGLGLPGGASSTPIGTTQWTVFESTASNLVSGDTTGTSDVFVTDGTTVTRLSVQADGTAFDGTNSFDPSICDSGRKVVFTTDADFAEADTNGAEDVYVIDRDADADSTFDEFGQSGGVTVSLVSATFDSELGETVVGFSSSGEAVISGDCSTAAFVTDNDLDLDDTNFLPDVYVRDLTDPNAAAIRVSVPAAEGGEGGGYLPAIDADGSRVAFTTEATDVVSESGTVGGVIVRDLEAGVSEYVTVRPDGQPSSGLPDTENPPSISDDGLCVAFKANGGFDLLAGNTGPSDGVFVWDDSGSSPVVELVSRDEAGVAAIQATAPKVTADCRFVGFQSSDEFIVSNDDNDATDVFVHDRETDTVALVSEGDDGDSAAASSNLADILWDATSGTGQVLVTTGAPSILGVSGDTSEIDLFRVAFESLELPAKPSAPTVVPGDSSLTVTWTAPSDGGSPITSYRVVTSPGGAVCTWSSGPLTCTVTGLTNGTAYRATVRATNAIGDGPVSDQSATATPRTVPSAVTGLTAAPANGAVGLTWAAPSSTGGAAITAYRVQRSTNGTTWTTVTSSAPLTRTFNVTGLTNGTRYSFRVAAINVAGVGTNSAVVASTPRTVASAPRALTARPRSRAVALSWTAPTSNGGAPITAYRVQRSLNGRTWTTVTSSAPLSRTFTVTGLRNGTQYSFRVAAVNAAGVGPNSAIVTARPRA